LNEIYPGGLDAYYEKAKVLLHQSKHAHNPYDDYKVGVPHGVKMDFRNQEMTEKFESMGMK